MKSSQLIVGVPMPVAGTAQRTRGADPPRSQFRTMLYSPCRKLTLSENAQNTSAANGAKVRNDRRAGLLWLEENVHLR